MHKLLKRIALSLELFESRVDSIAIILMDIKSEVADLILFKKREGFILPTIVLVLEVSSTYPN